MAVTEKRTQLYLSQGDYRRLREMAHRKGCSIASLVREAIQEYFQKTELQDAWESDPLLKLVGFFEGEKDLSKRHDEYLYGLRRKG